MRILVTSNMYPSDDSYFGIFVKRQIESLENIGIDIKKVAKTTENRCAYVPFVLKSTFFSLFNNCDLVHAHYGFHSALLPAIIKRKPLVITFHRGDALDEPFRNKLYCKLQKFVVSRADFLIAVSSEIKEALIEHLGARSDKVSVITCGVDTRAFLPLEKKIKRVALGIPENSKVVLFIGNLNHRKGVDLLLECAKRMQETYFILIGEGNIRAGTKNCRIVDPQPNHELTKWYNVADVFLLPSRSEGTPVVILEALSCGIPVVASKVGGIPDLIKDGATGYLIEPGDVDTLEERMRDLLQNPEKRRQMGLQARKNIIENYDSFKIAERIKQVYEKVLSNK